MGGMSSEREVSLRTGRGVQEALLARGYSCVAIDWQQPSALPGLLINHRVSVVWNALHGTFGEDGAVQGLLCCLGIPFTGSGILASALAMDKLLSKQMFVSHGIPTPAWKVALCSPREDTFSFPLVVKPSQEGSSVGVSIVHTPDKLEEAVKVAQGCKGAVLLEEYIAGAELHVGILDGTVLGSIEVCPTVDFYDYDAKYQREDTSYLVPPRLEAKIVKAAEAIALRAHGVLGCGSYSRVDMRISPRGEPFVLEVNTLPGMTSHSLLPKIAAHVGIDYATLCERILARAIGGKEATHGSASASES